MPSVRPSSRLVGVLVALVIGAAPLLAGCGSSGSTSGTTAGTTAPAPALVGTDLGGAAYDLADQQGHWVIVAFQASTCVPCTKELPMLHDFAAAHPDVRLVSVGLAETPEDFSSFLAPYDISWPAVPDRDGSISERWNVDALPITVAVDPSGQIRHTWTGVVSSDELAATTA